MLVIKFPCFCIIVHITVCLLGRLCGLILSLKANILRAIDDQERRRAQDTSPHSTLLLVLDCCTPQEGFHGKYEIVKTSVHWKRLRRQVKEGSSQLGITYLRNRKVSKDTSVSSAGGVGQPRKTTCGCLYFPSLQDSKIILQVMHLFCMWPIQIQSPGTHIDLQAWPGSDLWMQSQV